VRFSSSDKCVYTWQGDGTGTNGYWSKGMGGSGLGLIPEVKITNFNASIGKLYLCDVSSNSITIDLSNFLTKNTSTTLYECNLNAGDYFEVYIIKGDTTQNKVTLSFTGLQLAPYNFNLNLEGQSGSDFIFDSNSYFRFTYTGDASIGFKINSMTGSVPSDSGVIGSMMPFGGFTPPSGYFFTDGASKSRVDYEALFNVLTFSITGTLTNGTKNVTTTSTSELYIGEKIEGTGIPIGTTITAITNSTTFVISNNATITGSTSILVIPYGSLTSETFRLPDYRGKVLVMPDGTTEFKTVGITGGERQHVLTTSEIPAHDHSNGVYNKLLKVDGTATAGSTDNSNEPNLYTYGTLQSVGGNQAHNNLQPYGCSNYIIKY
jgi:microcystin-dependent protein